jgi:hypothetical protein
MEIHVVCVMSNHYHLVVTDPRAQLPEFSYILNKYMSKCMNAHYGRWENFWAGGTQPSYVRLGDDKALLDKAVYAITNPVESALVGRSSSWPGVLLWKPARYKAKRPDWFFGTSMPETLWLEVSPPRLEGGQVRPRVVMQRLGELVVTKEKQIRAALRADQRTVLGLAAIRRQSHLDSPRSSEPRRGMSPRVASRDKWRRVEILQRLKTFYVAYLDARQRWSRGQRRVVFPAGTYKLRLQHTVLCTEH